MNLTGDASGSGTIQKGTQPEPGPQGPVSIYFFDESSGGVAHDVLSNAHANYRGDVRARELDPMTEGGRASTYLSPDAYVELPISEEHVFEKGTALAVCCQLRRLPSSKATFFSRDNFPNPDPGALGVEAIGSSIRTYVWDGAVIQETRVDNVLEANKAFWLTVCWGDQVEVYIDTRLVAELPFKGPWPSKLPATIGRYSGGEQTENPTDLAVGDMAIWDRPLDAGEVADLPTPKTIELPAPPPIEGPIVPRTDLFLVNDDQEVDAVTKGTIRYARPRGTGVGGSVREGAGDLHATLAASSPGDTVVCLQGYYGAARGLTIPGGTDAHHPVTLVAEPGSWATIVKDIEFTGILPDLAEGQVRGDGSIGDDYWELYDASTNTWRIRYIGNATRLTGCWFEGGMAHWLLPYPSLNALMSAQDTAGPPQTQDQFWFSGLAVDGDWAYLRLARPNRRDNGDVDPQFGGWPDDDRYHLGIEGQHDAPKWFIRANPADWRTGQPELPEGRDPNDMRVYIADGRLDAQPFLRGECGDHIRIGSGINSLGYERFSDEGQVNRVEVHRGCHWLWRFLVMAGQDITFHRARLFCGEHRLQGSMAVLKYSNFLNPPYRNFEGWTPWGMWGGPHINVVFDNCTISGYHEFMLPKEGQDGLRLVNCSIHMGYDEFMQGNAGNMNHVEIGWCYFRDSASLHGSDLNERGNQAYPGSILWHHLIVDNRLPRASFDSPRPINGGTYSIGRANGVQASRKVYNCTLIGPPDPASGVTWELGVTGNTNPNRSFNDPAHYDEDFNNIVILHDRKRYRQIEGGIPNTMADCIESRVKIGSDGAERHYRDYNLYCRILPVRPDTNQYSHPAFFRVGADSAGKPDEEHFDAIRDGSGRIFYGSGPWQRINPPTPAPSGARFEEHSTDANPDIPSCRNSFPDHRLDYRPRRADVVEAPGTPPSMADWWTDPEGHGWPMSYGAVAVPYRLAPSPWKGALSPHEDDEYGIGVQNP